MTDNVFRRSLYAVKEIKRVIQACTALDKGDIETLGKLMFEKSKLGLKSLPLLPLLPLFVNIE